MNINPDIIVEEMPLGTIAKDVKGEMSTNSYGTAIKHEDGIMICFMKVEQQQANFNQSWYNWSLWNSNTVNWQFPMPFVEQPSINVTLDYTINDTAGGGVCVGYQATNEAITNIRVARPAAGSIKIVMNIIAIGKWK